MAMFSVIISGLCDTPSSFGGKIKTKNSNSSGEYTMEQKYVLEKKDTVFIIRELAETEPGKFAMLFEEKLDIDRVKSAIEGGKRKLIDLFRSNNMYPPNFFAEMVAKGIMGMFGNDPKDKLTIEFNDNDALIRKGTLPVEVVIVDEKELAEIDQLLEDEDEISDDFDD